MKFLPFLLLLIPSLALADVKPKATRVNNRCTQYAMCATETTTNECKDKDGQVIVLGLDRYARMTFYSTKSSSINYSCDIFTSNEGFDNKTASDQVNTTSITDEAPVYTLVALLRDFWMICPTNDNNSVTIDVVVCAAD